MNRIDKVRESLNTIKAIKKVAVNEDFDYEEPRFLWSELNLEKPKPGEKSYLVVSYDKNLDQWGIEGQYNAISPEAAQEAAMQDNRKQPSKRINFTAFEFGDPELEKIISPENYNGANKLGAKYDDFTKWNWTL